MLSRSNAAQQVNVPIWGLFDLYILYAKIADPSLERNSPWSFKFSGTMLYSKEQHVRTIGVTQWVFAIKWIFKMKNYGPTVFTVGPVPIAIGIDGTSADTRASGGIDGTSEDSCDGQCVRPLLVSPSLILFHDLFGQLIR